MPAAWCQLMICGVCPLLLKTSLFFLWQDQPENHLGHCVLDPRYQSHRVMPNMFTASRGPCGRVTKDNSLRSHKSFFSIWGTSPSKKKMPFASRWGQPMGTFFPIAGSVALLSLAGSTWYCCRFRLSWCNCFPGPSSWTLLPGYSVFCSCRSADRSGSLPPVARSHKFPAFFPLTCVNVWGMCSAFYSTS